MRFYDACSYTSHLSAIVKLTQLIVIQHSVFMKDTGQISHAADALRVVRDPWLMRNSATPFAFILTIRGYGRRIRNNTTSAGFISWSNDFSQLAYKDIQLRIPAVRCFLQCEMAMLQTDLSELLLSPSLQKRPWFELDQLKDNPANSKTNWSFLQESRNKLLSWKSWLMNRVLTQEELRQQFFQENSIARQSPIYSAWKVDRVQAYLKLERRFLARLAMLMYMLSGQPARGTELMSLRYRNTAIGGYRNIYIEHGLVTYPKWVMVPRAGYHCFWRGN